MPRQNLTKAPGSHPSAGKRPPKAKAADLPAVVETKPADLAVAERARARRKDRPTPARMKLEGAHGMAIDHANQAVGWAILSEAVGSDDRDFQHGLIHQLTNALSKGKDADIAALNFGLSVVQGVGPRDQIEAMLAAQMAAVHDATMREARLMNHAVNIDQLRAHDGALNRLARTFSAQVAALKAYRSGGEQRMTVEHVHVHAGGQAVVGQVTGRRGD